MVRTVRRGGLNVPQTSSGGGERVADVVSSTDNKRTSFPWCRRRVSKRRVWVRTTDTFSSDLLSSTLRCRLPIRWVQQTSLTTGGWNLSNDAAFM